MSFIRLFLFSLCALITSPVFSVLFTSTETSCIIRHVSDSGGPIFPVLLEYGLYQISEQPNTMPYTHLFYDGNDCPLPANQVLINLTKDFLIFSFYGQNQDFICTYGEESKNIRNSTVIQFPRKKYRDSRVGFWMKKNGYYCNFVNFRIPTEGTHMRLDVVEEEKRAEQEQKFKKKLDEAMYKLAIEPDNKVVDVSSNYQYFQNLLVRHNLDEEMTNLTKKALWLNCEDERNVKYRPRWQEKFTLFDNQKFNLYYLFDNFLSYIRHLPPIKKKMEIEYGLAVLLADAVEPGNVEGFEEIQGSLECEKPISGLWSYVPFVKKTETVKMDFIDGCRDLASKEVIIMGLLRLLQQVDEQFAIDPDEIRGAL